jgi:hypothetical protein
MAAIAVAGAHQCLQTEATIENTTTTSTLRSRTVTKHKAQATTTWSFPNVRCTELRRC